MAFNFKKCGIEGLWEIQPQFFGDNRGYFIETYSKKDFVEAGLSINFVQDNLSYSKKGVLRGLHFQKEYPQGKLISVIEGSVYDVAVDLRNNSPSFGKYYGTILSSDKKNMLYIPEGFAHGFYVLSDNALFSYKCTELYHAEDQHGIIWNDKNLNINWKDYIKDNAPVLSEKDLALPVFDNKLTYFKGLK